MNCRSVLRLAVTLFVATAASRASANTDINGLFDARSTAMAGTGAAFIDSAAAIPINPAALDQIGKLSLTVDGTLLVAQPQAPYTVTHSSPDGGTYKNYETIRSDRAVGPLFFLGAAYRVADRVVVGAAVYPLLGMGTHAEYRPSPDLLPKLNIRTESAAGLLEVGVPVSVRILDNLSIAAMWRISYMSQSATQPISPDGMVRDAAGNPIYAKLDVNGWNFGGLQLGILYKPLPSLRFGLTYRSKVKVNGSGTTTTTNPADGMTLQLDSRAPFTNPHTFRAGVAWTTLQDKLLIAADFKYLLYAEAYKDITTTVVMDGVPRDNVTVTKWKNAYAIQFGAEYAAYEEVSFRAGYTMVMSATSKDYAKAAMPPPGPSHGVSIGVGAHVIDNVSVDVALEYIAYSIKVDKATPNNAGIGTYASNAGQFGVSATYRTP
jgi:long-chain fatty acid transport protein